MEQKLEISIDSTIDNMAKVETFIDKIFERLLTRRDHADKRLGQITLSIIEAATNAIKYGGGEDVTKKVSVVAERIGNKLKVTVSDQGKGFDYSIIPNPTLPENTEKESKRGLYIMTVLTDENLVFENNGATIIMTFDLDK